MVVKAVGKNITIHYCTFQWPFANPTKSVELFFHFSYVFIWFFTPNLFPYITILHHNYVSLTGRKVAWSYNKSYCSYFHLFICSEELRIESAGFQHMNISWKKFENYVQMVKLRWKKTISVLKNTNKILHRNLIKYWVYPL